jgi:glycosyltransferase involved in cell wall biosynthesis
MSYLATPLTAERPINLMLHYWGRRGLSEFSAAIALAASAHPELAVTLAISRANSEKALFAALGDRLLELDLYESPLGSIAQLWRTPAVRRQIKARFLQDRIDISVTLLQHIWLPMLAPAWKAMGVPHVVLVHDAVRHPGDPTGFAHGLKMFGMSQVDRAITLSGAVTKQLLAQGTQPDRVTTLFHPDISIADHVPTRESAVFSPGRPWRLLFLGRIQRYKGLALLVEAAGKLRAAGKPVELTVMGEPTGSLPMSALEAIGAKVVLRWLSTLEMAEAIDQHDLVVLPYIEASQSGIVAMAHGRGAPVVATPVGGLAEQIEHGMTGLIASAVTADALGAAIIEAFETPGLLDHLTEKVLLRRDQRSPTRFVEALVPILRADIARRATGSARIARPEGGT